MLTRTERLALLLNILGDDAATMAREGLKGEQLDDLEAALKDFEEYPPSKLEVDLVLDDFETYFKMILDTSESKPKKSGNSGGGGGGEGEGEFDDDEGPKILQIAEENFDVDFEPQKKFEAPKLTGDTGIDLNRVHPYQVAQALAAESPAVMSLVIGTLHNDHAAKTLEFLPETTRAGVFLTLAEPSSIRPVVADRIMATVLERALEVEERELETESSVKLASLMRSLPRSIRQAMMTELANKDEDLAGAVKKLLYRFEDLKRLEDRDLQKFLGQCSSDCLVVALQGVDEDLLERILGNMSKRAKEALTEEMEFKTNAKQDEIDAGRAEVVTLLSELVESGAVSLE
ncbi:MAG: FliG C-terminal domain-containing protein [Planctomycetota bacterium]